MRTLQKKLTLIDALYSGETEIYYFYPYSIFPFILTIRANPFGSSFTVSRNKEFVAEIYIEYNIFFHDAKNYRLSIPHNGWNDNGNAIYNIFDLIHYNKPLPEDHRFYFTKWSNT